MSGKENEGGTQMKICGTSEHQKTEGEKSLKLPDQQNNIVKIQSVI